MVAGAEVVVGAEAAVAGEVAAGSESGRRCGSGRSPQPAVAGEVVAACGNFVTGIFIFHGGARLGTFFRPNGYYF